MKKKSQNISRLNSKTANTNASPAAYGWCFQVGAGITLMLDNLKDFSFLKMEGASDDIELTTKAGKIYAQAKSVVQMGDQRNASTNLKEAMRTLSHDVNNGDAVRLIYITNIVNPLSVSSEISSAFQFDDSYEFSVLPDEAQSKIRELVDDDFPCDKFQLNIIRFFGEGNNKFKSVKDKISEFLREAIDDPSYNQRLLESWFETFMVNAADKPDKEKKLELSKKQIILPVIVVAIDKPIQESEFSKVCDHDNYNEIEQRFRDVINRNVCDYEFYAGVCGEYLSKRREAIDKTNYKYEYVKNEWKSFEPQFSIIKNAETREALIKLLLLTVIKQSGKIEDIRGATNI
jgi:hypothetical protein